MAVTITLGFTCSDRATGYSSFDDGYRPGARQDTVEVEVDGTTGLSGEGWAEAVFVASNAPGEGFCTDQPGAVEVYAALAGLRRNGARLRTLSKGDTVTVDGIRYACASAGWEVVS